MFRWANRETWMRFATNRHRRHCDLFVTFGASKRHFRSLPLRMSLLELFPESRCGCKVMSAEKPPIRKRWRYFTRRHAFLAAIIVGVGALALILLVLFLFRLGFVDRYVANQIKQTFRELRHTRRDQRVPRHFSAQHRRDVRAWNSTTRRPAKNSERSIVSWRPSKSKICMHLNLQRNINLEDLQMEGLELWVTFDDQGRSNFRNIHIPPPEPNRRILFAYSSANIEIKNGVVHYGDVRHDISGEARNLQRYDSTRLSERPRRCSHDCRDTLAFEFDFHLRRSRHQQHRNPDAWAWESGTRRDSRVDFEVARRGSASRWRHGRLACASLRDECHFEC